MSTRIERIQNAVEAVHNCHAVHSASVPVHDVFRGETFWEGVVEVFAIDHPKAKRCYAWEIPGAKPDWVAVLEIPPVTSPQTAVKAMIVARGKGKV